MLHKYYCTWISNATSYSLTQAAMLVACLWGIFAFKVSTMSAKLPYFAHTLCDVLMDTQEITGRENIMLFGLGAGITFTGLVITAVFGSS